MNMKTRNKIMLLALCMVALIAVSVLGTMAYLTSADKVTNTFTVGNVNITLDEAKVDTDGKQVEGADRVKANEYHLMPGHLYTKDPTVHVTEGSENCWLFVKVENGISAFEAEGENTQNGYKTIEDQITVNGWTKLTGVDDVDNVYYRSFTNGDDAQRNFAVFNNFKIADDANSADDTKTAWGNVTTDKPTITVTAYAIQKDGFDTEIAAWNAVKDTAVTTTAAGN